MATLEPELYDILAQLDFLVQQSKKMALRDKRFEDHKTTLLKEIARRMGKRYTAGRVKEKLLEAFRYGEMFPDNAFDLVFAHGSSAFQLSAEQRAGIETHLALVVKRGPTGRTLRSRNLRSELITPVKTRSLRQRTAPAGPTALIKDHRSRSRSTKSNANSRVMAMVTYKKRRRGKSPRKADEVVVPSIEIKETPCGSPDLVLSSAEVSPPTMSAITSAEQQDTNTSDATSVLCLSDIHVCPKPRSEPQSEPEPEWAPPVVSESDLTMVIAEIAYYKKRCEEAEERAEREHNQRRQLQSLSEDPEAAADTINQLIRKNNTIQKLLGDRRSLERYLPIGNIQYTAPGSQQVIMQFEQLKNRLPSPLIFDDIYEPSLGRLKDHPGDLQELLIDIFGKDLLYGPQEMLDIFPSLTILELIQSLVGAALKSWIFENQCQTYTFAMTPLLQEYRKLIGTICGHDSLCGVDHAVHRTIIGSQTFETTIVPGLTELLTNRIINALEPVFRSGPKGKLPKKLEASLRSVIRMAVRIRSEMLITGDSYELIWPSVGFSFDRKEMLSEGAVSNTGTKAVRLPLCPGLRVYAKANAMVDHRGFKAIAANTASPKHVVKALVLR